MTKIIKTQNNELIVVEVPEDACKFIKDNDEICHYIMYSVNVTETSEDVIATTDLEFDFDFKILGKLSELSEEECDRFVVKVMNNQHYQNYNYKNIVDRWVKTAKASLISLLQANGVDCSNLNTLLLIEKI